MSVSKTGENSKVLEVLHLLKIENSQISINLKNHLYIINVYSTDYNITEELISEKIQELLKVFKLTLSKCNYNIIIINPEMLEAAEF